MLRSILLLLGSAAAGAAAYVAIFDEPSAADDAFLNAPSTAAPAAPAPAANVVPVGDGLAALQAAAEIDDAARVETLLAAALADPRGREAEIEALFARLAALDVRRAVRMSRMRGLDERLVVELFRFWGEQDADGALRELASIARATDRIDAALELLEAIGNNAGNIRLVSAALPIGQQIDFEARALAKRAETDPHGALAEALAFADPAARSTAAQRIGMAWSHADPLAAVKRAESLPPELKEAYRDAVIVEWGRLDTPGFVSFLETEPQLRLYLLGIAQAMAHDPASMFELAGRKPGTSYYNMGSIERVAFGILAQVDREAARAQLETFEYDPRGRQLTDAFAEAYARAAPEEALAWASGLDPRRPGLEATVIAQAANANWERGLALLRSFDPPADHPSVTGGIASVEGVAASIGTALAASPQRREIADNLLRREDDVSKLVLQRITTQWVNNDPAGALDWMLAHGSTMSEALVANIGAQLAARDANTAVQYLERLSAEQRRIWFPLVAGPYARQDPRGASGWIVQFQGHEGYDAVLRQVVTQSAQTDPSGAAALLSIAPAEVQKSAAVDVASAWARDDLTAAGRWAAALSDPSARTSAVAAVANNWAVRDPVMAQRWVANLPAGEVRDSALATVLGRILRDGGDFERSFASAFASMSAFERAIVNELPNVAMRDPERAERLLRTWVGSPDERRRAEELIAAAARSYGL